ncbi:phage tail protein [Pseudomonas sp. P155]|uniref:Phage tail protein n=1 Tax=Pseudomonas neuropathica TaxID=2730425 RepID=A0ABS0BFC2_9PSED|nr:phage tail protein [Pseudomonas neuropathica]MBF6033038.1 phage tail protein [Pseudomonas neuropathica]
MADYYTLLTNAGIAYETACKAAGTPIKLTQISVGDGGGTVYNPAATATALKREVWRGPLNALFQDEKNPSWLLAEVTIPPDVGGWYVREAGLWTDTGILYAIVKYPESFKPVLATSGSGKEFYIRSIFETSNASLVTLLIDDTVVKATRAWVAEYVADELAKLDAKQSVRVATTGNITLKAAQTVDGVAVVPGDRVLVKNQTLSKDNGLYVVANEVWIRAKDADSNLKVTPTLTVSVEQGTTQADTIWQLVTDGPVLLGTTALVFQNITFGLAPLSSPVFSGSPTAPTASAFSNDDVLATTKFVQRALGSYAGQTNYDSNTQLTVADVGKLSIFTTAGLTATLPDWNSVPPGGLVHLTSTGGLTVKTRAGETFGAVNTTNLTSVVLQPGNFAVFRRLLLGPGWSLDSGDAALKYSPMFQSLLTGTNGYKKDPSGLIEQWGFLPGYNTGGTISVVYPTAFTTSTFSIMTQRMDGVITSGTIVVNSSSLSGFSFVDTGLPANDVNAIYWTAKGK